MSRPSRRSPPTSAGRTSCRTHPFLCGDEGVELIKKEIQEGANALVIAACSPRFNTDTFTFDGCLTERVNLRELVVWSHPPNDEDTQMLAEDYLRMGIARAKKAEIPEPFEAEIDKTILVVGGGQTGMTAALEAAKAGYEVVLVEKEPQLGGWLKKFSKLFPKKPPYRDLEPVDLESRVSEIEAERADQGLPGRDDREDQRPARPVRRVAPDERLDRRSSASGPSFRPPAGSRTTLRGSAIWATAART